MSSSLPSPSRNNTTSRNSFLRNLRVEFFAVFAGTRNGKHVRLALLLIRPRREAEGFVEARRGRQCRLRLLRFAFDQHPPRMRDRQFGFLRIARHQGCQHLDQQLALGGLTISSGISAPSSSRA